MKHFHSNSKLFSDKNLIDLQASLIPIVMRRLGEAEGKVAQLSKELDEAKKGLKERDQKIQQLNDEVAELQKSTKALKVNTKKHIQSKYQELLQRCHKAEKQLFEMETFLADYGLMWIGDDPNNIQVNIPGSEPQISQPGEDVEIPQINFDVLLYNLAQLNMVAGAGEPQLSYTTNGATFKVAHSIRLTLYSNGLILSEGPFRAYTDYSTKVFVQDIFDGYFPSELQKSYPNGISFEIRDKHTILYPEDSVQWKPFSGAGYKLGGKQENMRKSTHNLAESSGVKNGANKIPD